MPTRISDAKTDDMLTDADAIDEFGRLRWRDVGEFMWDMIPMWAVVVLLCALLGWLFSGCASVNQRVVTMDGDTFEQRGFSLFSKQDIAQASSAEFFPNNSGSTIDLNTDAAQDSTDAIAALLAGIMAIGKALSGGGALPSPASTDSAPQTSVVTPAAPLFPRGLAPIRPGGPR